MTEPILPVQPPEPERRRRPSTFGGLIYLIVVATTVTGLCLVAFGPWRRGIALVGVGFLFASGMRLVIHEGEAGMLRVRGRWFDVAALAGVGIALITLSTNIPDQPGL
ncbi:MAG: putative integral rane protein [Marmoricola sp.]|nr:putative integral rane protein [Marmoricola sp.]